MPNTITTNNDNINITVHERPIEKQLKRRNYSKKKYKSQTTGQEKGQKKKQLKSIKRSKKSWNQEQEKSFQNLLKPKVQLKKTIEKNNFKYNLI